MQPFVIDSREIPAFHLTKLFLKQNECKFVCSDCGEKILKLFARKSVIGSVTVFLKQIIECFMRFQNFKVDENRSYRVHVIMPVVTSSVFRNSRSVFIRRSLKPGRYVIVASTFDPGVLGSFLLRTYTGGSISIRSVS